MNSSEFPALRYGGVHAQKTDTTTALFTELLKQLVDSPDQLQIGTALGANDDVCIQVSAPPADIGKVIGRNGRTAQALRVLLAAVGAARKIRYTLNIVEPLKQSSD